MYSDKKHIINQVIIFTHENISSSIFFFFFVLPRVFFFLTKMLYLFIILLSMELNEAVSLLRDA